MTDPSPVVEPFPEPVRERLAAGAFVLVDKPRGPSSHQVAAWTRDILGVDHTGHAGTLDPNVSGLLWVGSGPALKLIPLLLEFPKRYIALVVLHSKVATKELERVLTEFTGPIYQTPPVRSAVKRERRVRTIHRLGLVEAAPPRYLLDIVGDSGTYVRTLAVDVGEALGVGAHLEELRRIGTGPFREDDVVPLTALRDAAEKARGGDAGDLLKLLHPIDEVWREFPTVVVKDAAASALAHGAALARGGIVSMSRSFSTGATVALVTRSGVFVAYGTAEVDADAMKGSKPGWVVTQTRVFADPARFPPRWGARSSERPAAAPTDA
ncbi:MAG: RNA-guided pseudouridylation complex pseudouridine synthase subunit Cbf5 [Thermoplasmata archaeon]|nr:RNA-guided pseudouridylation complex pseudouridine synthase subunit Cbf5 [Thermoplasmata archaeon]